MNIKLLKLAIGISVLSVGLTACGSAKTNEKTNEPKKVEEKKTEDKKEEKKTEEKNGEKKGAYKDGEYVSDVVDTEHGPLQIKVIVQEGVIANIEALSIPDKDEPAKRVNGAAVPEYIKLALEKQDDNVDKVSGATYTHGTFNKALKSALDKAR